MRFLGNNGSILFYLQSFNSREVVRIAGDDGLPAAECNACNHGIYRLDALALSKEETVNQAAADRRFNIKRPKHPDSEHGFDMLSFDFWKTRSAEP